MVVVGFVLMLCTSCTALLRWNEVRYRKKGLPPGTMGWPIIGETTEFLKQGPNFMKNQRARWLIFCLLIVSRVPASPQVLMIKLLPYGWYNFCNTIFWTLFSNNRYGNFFKTHFLGCPAIISMDPEMNRYILMNEAKGLVPGYPQSMSDILGKCNIAAVHGTSHKHMRGALLALISPTMIRDQLLPKIDAFMRTHLSDWDNKIINIQDKTKEVCLIIMQFD